VGSSTSASPASRTEYQRHRGGHDPRYAGVHEPEQARGAEVDARSDLFSLGGVIYRLFAGCVPFKGDTAFNTVLALTNEPHVPLAVAAPAGAGDTVAARRRPAGEGSRQRPASAKEVVKELKRIEAKAARRGAAGIHGDCDQRYEQHLGGARDRRARQHGGAQFADRGAQRAAGLAVGGRCGGRWRRWC